MSSLCAREDESSFSLDHLHTRSPALAGIASKATDGSNARSARRRPARLTWLRLVALPLAMIALVTAGGAAVEAGAAEPPVAVDSPNTVTGFGGAADLSPDGGLSVSSPIVDITANPSGRGYWLAAADGGVFTYGDAQFFGSLGTTPLNAPVVDIAATPSGEGYWLVASDGGVFSFGDAQFRGSLGGHPLTAPILGIAAAPAGSGYWLVGADGGVFAFGDAYFYGSGLGLTPAAPVVEIAPSPTGGGYWLLATDGGVFAFGDAAFAGSGAGGDQRDAIGIAAAPGGKGYWIVRRSGAVQAFGAPALGEVTAEAASGASYPAIGIAARAGGGYWIAQGDRAVAAAPADAGAPDVSQHPFLVCTRRRESGGNYSVVSRSGTYRGAYQFSRSTWDSTARHAGRLDLVGVDPAAAAPADQDAMALDLYRWQGASPWLGRCAGL